MQVWPSNLSIVTPKVMEVGGLGSAYSPGSMALGHTSTVYPVANLAIFVPFRTAEIITVKNLFCLNGTAVSGNIDMGIYTPDGTRLVSKGTTAQAGASAPQQFDITDTTLGPGLYYLAVAMDTATTATLLFAATTAAFGKVWGLAQMATAFPLPATATFATFAQTIAPFLGLATRASPI